MSAHRGTRHRPTSPRPTAPPGWSLGAHRAGGQPVVLLHEATGEEPAALVDRDR